MKKGNPVLAVIMFGVMAVAVVTIARNIYSPYTPVAISANEVTPTASQIATPTPDMVGTAVITVVGADGNAITEAGATVNIMNVLTGVSYTEPIEQGKLVFDLPLGSYSVKQLTAAVGYDADVTDYQFTLPEAGQSSGAASTDVVLVNNAAVASQSTPVPTASPAPIEAPVPAAEPVAETQEVEEVPKVDAITAEADAADAASQTVVNPKTGGLDAHITIVTAAVVVLLVVLSSMFVYIRRLKKSINRRRY